MSPQSSESRSHYDTLGLKQDCTPKEIKDAFLSLSKVHHPDKNPNDPSKSARFVRIYEAYAVLSRPGRRLVYDSDLSRCGGRNGRVETNAPYYTSWRDESIWSMRDKTGENFRANKPYYGIKGINRVSNYWIAGGAVFLMVIGALFHYTALKHSTTFTVAQLDTRDEKIARELFKTRQIAIKNGNDLQLALLQAKFGWNDEGSKKTD